MKYITCMLISILITFTILFGIDGEVARKERADSQTQTECIFNSNCWN